jgi:hypothetical protein
MEYWEFLLQGEGDQNWLPLDASQVEILEGRYRVMAHTSQTDTAVNIRISQLLFDQTPPKRRSLKRQGKISKDGLLVVIPFTHLTAGTWSIYCTGSTETTGETPSSWQYAVQLQVLPYESGEDGDWFADDGTAQLPGSDAVSATAEQSLEGAADINLEQIAEVLQNSQAQMAENNVLTESLYQVSLSQTALVAQQGQAVSLSVQVTGASQGETARNQALVVRLTDPQNAAPVVLEAYKLPAATLPAMVSLPVVLPDDLSTRLLLGEVALVSTEDEVGTLLALQRFTVTIDLAALFDAIADQAETADELDIVFPPDVSGGSKPVNTEDETESSAPSGWDNVDFLNSPPRSVPSMTLPRGGLPLPPRIYYPSPHEAQAHTPVLPPLGKPKPSPQPRVTSTEDAGTEAITDTPEASTDLSSQAAEAAAPSTPSAASPPVTQESPTKAPQSPAQGLSLPPIPRPKFEATVSSDASELKPSGSPSPASDTTQQGNKPPKSQVPLLPSHEDMGFRELKLQERFWSRLNDLAVNIQQEAQQQQDSANQESEATLATESLDDGPLFIPFAGEVVIYEDEDETLQRARDEALANAAGDSLPVEDEEPISPLAPEIELQEGELTAGETVILTLRVPFHPNRMYLKVWIVDPQTRSLADEPRQLMNLSPDGHGHLEGSVQIEVPQGCLEVWFEAIAVDMITHQESYKTSVSRSVVPSGVPSPSLDEFDF